MLAHKLQGLNSKVCSLFVICSLFLGIFGSAFALEIGSSAFTSGGKITAQYACDSNDISPELLWKNAPSGTKSFVLICDDPDAPVGIWTHWVVFNIPFDSKRLIEDISKTGTLKDGTIQGVNDFGKNGYGGPCPPPGKVHRYFFKLYALDTKLSLGENSKQADVLKAAKGHILATAEVFATYSR